MKFKISPPLLVFFPLFLFAQHPYGKEALAHTYSIVAIDPEAGEMGAAVQSHWFSVGKLVIWGEPGVGIIATQFFVNPACRPEGLHRSCPPLRRQELRRAGQPDGKGNRLASHGNYRQRSFNLRATRSSPQYTLKACPRRKPTSVIPYSSPSSTARLEGAPTAARMGTPAITDF